jgi:regulator of protease activity HflC (stomatin/prohibitin superfamily)
LLIDIDIDIDNAAKSLNYKILKDMYMDSGLIVSLVLLTLLVIIVFTGIKIVPQSNEYVVERFGKFSKTLKAGVNYIVPIIDTVKHNVSILERQLESFQISVITRDNVEVKLETTVFFRIIDAAKSVYRISDIDRALQTTSESIVRSAAGKLDLDELQSSREEMNEDILKNLRGAADIWGIEITRSEITDVIVDERTKDAQRQQLNAEREKRAAIAKAEGDKRSMELLADAKLYEAQKVSEAIKIEADANAYSIEAEAKATAAQTRMVAEAINNNGQAAVNYDILKRQVDGLAMLAASDNSKTVIMPTDITKAIGSLELITSMLGIGNNK